tara:strand:+ start:1123 stop:1320 length:198 start_codon:yes stop_codon:yes gene_type:complete
MDNKEWMSSIEIVDEVVERGLLPDDVAKVIAQLVILGDNNVDDRDCIWVAIRELSTGVLRNGEEE